MTTRPGYPEDRPPTMEERIAFWNERYANEGWVFGVEPNRFVERFLGDLQPGTLLDLGCGQGRNAVWLAQQGHDVTGVDLSPVAIEQARELANRVGVDATFVAADLTDWDAPTGSFECVVLSYLQLLEDQRSVIHATAQRVLAPGGVLFLIAHHADNLAHGFGGPQIPDVLFTETQLAADFDGLAIEQLDAVDRVVVNDDGEHTAIDIVLMARKPR